ncbi:MAG: sensor histidine kinase [Armatimonadota bacterium]
MRVHYRSVRSRLTYWYAGSKLIILLAVLAGIYFSARSFFSQHVVEETSKDMSRIQAAIAAQQNERGTKHLSGSAISSHQDQPSAVQDICAVLDVDFNQYPFALTGQDPMVFQSSEWMRAGLKIASIRRNMYDETLFIKGKEKHYGVAYKKITIMGNTYTLYVAHRSEALIKHLDQLKRIILISIPCAFLLAIVSGYLLAGHFLSPIGKMATSAQRISAASLSERLPVESEEDEFGRLAIVFNQTLDRLENAFAQLSRFTADASHELRTPLAAMRSIGEVALSSPMNARGYRDTIGSMLEEIARLSSTTDSLLLLTRGDADRYADSFEPINLGTLCRETVDCLCILAEEKNQSLELSVEDNLIVTGNHLLLQRAILNLLDNAIKYSPQGGSINVRAHAASSSEAVVEVHDTGIGIPIEYQQQIFNRFFRVCTDLPDSPSGDGLGLAVSKLAADIHKGRLGVESTVGAGSTFRLILPLQR